MVVKLGSLTTVHFVDSIHGWAGGSGIYKTTDGGVTWTSFGVAMVPRAISMADTLTGWAVGDDGSAGKIYKTTDGGISWFKQVDILWRRYEGTATRTLEKNITAGGTTNSSPDTGKIVETIDSG